MKSTPVSSVTENFGNNNEVDVNELKNQVLNLQKIIQSNLNKTNNTDTQNNEVLLLQTQLTQLQSVVKDLQNGIKTITEEAVETMNNKINKSNEQMKKEISSQIQNDLKIYNDDNAGKIEKLLASLSLKIDCNHDESQNRINHMGIVFDQKVEKNTTSLVRKINRFDKTSNIKSNGAITRSRAAKITNETPLTLDMSFDSMESHNPDEGTQTEIPQTTIE
jgi:hypothetical protein